MVGVMMVDLSTAFDMVDHYILLEKLKLHCLESPAIQWFQSYLADRSQTVCVDGCLSPFLKIHTVVSPKGQSWARYCTSSSPMTFQTVYMKNMMLLFPLPLLT